MELQRHNIKERIREGERCEGCNKLFKHPRRSLIYFAGRHICRNCSKRKSMPIVGYKDKIKWRASKKIEKKKRSMPYMTWNEQQVIWRECMKNGLSEYEARSRISSIKSQIRRAHWVYQKQQPVEKKKILPIEK